MTERTANAALKALVERIERLAEEKKALQDDINEVFAEAKGTGFDVKAMREIIGRRKMDADELQERDAILETYMFALGMLGGVSHASGRAGEGSTGTRAMACAARDDDTISSARLGDLPGADGCAQKPPASHRAETSLEAQPDRSAIPVEKGGDEDPSPPANSQSPSTDGDRPRSPARNPDAGEADDTAELPPFLQRNADNWAPFMGEKRPKHSATGPPG
jgi:uncharacterized protein (UPF0335 family)